jgi:pimeloyl-ACP methyl ester carboxylesterase
VPLINAHILAWRIPNARLHVVRGGGHMFLLERPAEHAALVATFLTAR